VAIETTLASPSPRSVLIVPPIADTAAASRRNCTTMVRRRAPSARRTPIPGPLTDRDQHHVHDADASHQEGDQPDAERHAVQRAGELGVGVRQPLGG
jgi:hypothetical protein